MANTRGTIAFDSTRDGKSAIFLLEVDSGIVHRITDVAQNYSPTWSYDAKHIAFTTYRTGKPEIYILNLQTGNEYYLVDGYDPAWSPVSNKIAYTRWHNDLSISQIWSIDTDKGNPTQLTHSSFGNLEPTWSPDGESLAFSSWRIPYNYLMMLRVRGKRGRILSRLNEHEPAWSPTGNHIAFRSMRNERSDIYILETKSKTQCQLIPSAPNWPIHPAWSPDATRICYAMRNDSNGYYNIYAVNADGSNNCGLTDFPAHHYHPTWCQMNTTHYYL